PSWRRKSPVRGRGRPRPRANRGCRSITAAGHSRPRAHSVQSHSDEGPSSRFARGRGPRRFACILNHRPRGAHESRAAPASCATHGTLESRAAPASRATHGTLESRAPHGLQAARRPRDVVVCVRTAPTFAASQVVYKTRNAFMWTICNKNRPETAEIVLFLLQIVDIKVVHDLALAPGAGVAPG